jgi:hypothetical protein
MNHELTAVTICALGLGFFALVVAFRNVELHRNAARFEDRLEGIEPVIFAAICEHNKDYALGYGDGEEMAERIAKAVRHRLNQP